MFGHKEPESKVRGFSCQICLKEKCLDLALTSGIIHLELVHLAENSLMVKRYSTHLTVGEDGNEAKEEQGPSEYEEESTTGGEVILGLD